MKATIVVIMALPLFLGCAYPSTQVRSVDDRPSLAVHGASDDSLLYVDGLDMGSARDYDGEDSALVLEKGTHKIEIRAQGKVVFSETLFLGGGQLKTITVSGTGGEE